MSEGAGAAVEPRDVQIALWKAVDETAKLERDLAALKAAQVESSVETALGEGGGPELGASALAEILRGQARVEGMKAVALGLAARHREAVAASYKARAEAARAAVQEHQMKIAAKRVEQAPLQLRWRALENEITSLEEGLRAQSAKVNYARRLGRRALQGSLAAMEKGLRTDPECTLLPSEFAAAAAALVAVAAKSGGAYKSAGQLMCPVVGEAIIEYDGATGRVISTVLNRVSYASTSGLVELGSESDFRRGEDLAYSTGHPTAPPVPASADPFKVGAKWQDPASSPVAAADRGSDSPI